MPPRRLSLPLPANMIEFDRLYRDDKCCRRALIEARWPGGMYVCPRCGHDDGIELAARPLIECPLCGHQTSATAGTLFHGSKLPLVTLFKLVYLIVAEKSGTNVCALSRQCGVSYRSATLWARKVRMAMQGRENRALSGVVEVDETMLGGPAPGHPGRSLGPNQAWVLVMVEDKDGHCGRVRLEAADTASAEELTGIIEEHIERGSTVRTDGWDGYGGLEANGYGHRVRVARTREDASVELPLVHRVASLLKRFVNGVLHGSWSRQWLPWVLEEFAFRFNRRASERRPLLFNRVLESGLKRPAPTRSWFQEFSRVVRGMKAA